MAVSKTRCSIKDKQSDCCNNVIIINHVCLLLQLSELEQRVLDAEGRADEAEDKVTKQIQFHFSNGIVRISVCYTLSSLSVLLAAKNKIINT